MLLKNPGGFIGVQMAEELFRGVSVLRIANQGDGSYQLKDTHGMLVTFTKPYSATIWTPMLVASHNSNAKARSKSSHRVCEGSFLCWRGLRGFAAPRQEFDEFVGVYVSAGDDTDDLAAPRSARQRGSHRRRPRAFGNHTVPLRQKRNGGSQDGCSMG